MIDADSANKHDLLLQDAKSILKEAETLLWNNSFTYDQTKAINRICGFANRQIMTLAETPTATCGNITVDFEHKTCFVNDTFLSLTLSEFNIIAPLVEADGRIIPYDQLVTASPQSLRSHAKNARQKLHAAGANRTIKSQNKIGYFLSET